MMVVKLTGGSTSRRAEGMATAGATLSVASSATPPPLPLPPPGLSGS